MNKTVYLRDEEVPIWEQARELSGDKLSPVIVAALKAFVARAEAEAKGYERIVVEFEDCEDAHLPKRKAFYGRWIITLDDPLKLKTGAGSYSASVADTMKGNAVIIETQLKASGNRTKFRVFPSLEQAAADAEFGYAAHAAILKRGVAIEELDI